MGLCVKIDPTDRKLEIPRLYQWARSHQSADPRAAVVCAKQILKREMTHLGAWNLIYHILGDDEPAGAFERSFIEYNFAHLREWYHRQRTAEYLQTERAHLEAQLRAWRKLFDEQNRTGFADRAPVYIILLLGVVSAVGFGLIVFGNSLPALFDARMIIGGALFLAGILLAVLGARRFIPWRARPPLAPQAPAEERWRAIETHFQQLLAELDTPGDAAATIPPAFALFLQRDAAVCPSCGRGADGHQCAPPAMPRQAR